jgi:hypothetical protein
MVFSVVDEHHNTLQVKRFVVFLVERQAERNRTELRLVDRQDSRAEGHVRTVLVKVVRPAIGDELPMAVMELRTRASVRAPLRTAQSHPVAPKFLWC